MKYIALIFLLTLSTNLKAEPDSMTYRILDAWIVTQNEGTEEAVTKFIKTYYAPELLSKIKNFEDHVNFYMTIIREFGDVQTTVYKTDKSAANKLKVQLLKKNSLLYPAPKPEEILVVEIDLDDKNRNYLKRGLGMGALICYIKR